MSKDRFIAKMLAWLQRVFCAALLVCSISVVANSQNAKVSTNTGDYNKARHGSSDGAVYHLVSLITTDGYSESQVPTESSLILQMAIELQSLKLRVAALEQEIHNRRKPQRRRR